MAKYIACILCCGNATERVAAILVTTHTTEQAAEQGGENKTHENQ